MSTYRIGHLMSCRIKGAAFHVRGTWSLTQQEPAGGHIPVLALFIINDATQRHSTPRDRSLRDTTRRDVTQRDATRLDVTWRDRNRSKSITYVPAVLPVCGTDGWRWLCSLVLTGPLSQLTFCLSAWSRVDPYDRRSNNINLYSPPLRVANN